MIFDFEYSPEPKFQYTFETHVQSLAICTFHLFHRLARTHLLPHARVYNDRTADIAIALVNSGHVGMNAIGYYLIIPCPPHPPSPLAFDLDALATLNAPVRAATIGDVDLLRSLTEGKRTHTRTDLRSRFPTPERCLDAIALAKARGELYIHEGRPQDFVWAPPGEKFKAKPKVKSKIKPKAKPKADRYAAVTPPWHAGLDLPKRKKPPKRRLR